MTDDEDEPTQPGRRSRMARGSVPPRSPHGMDVLLGIVVTLTLLGFMALYWLALGGGS